MITENRRMVLTKDININFEDNDETDAIKAFCKQLWAVCEREPYDIGEIVIAIAKGRSNISTHSKYDVTIN